MSKSQVGQRTKLTRAQRAMRARIASEISWARTDDRAARTASARRAALDRFDKQVDPAITDPAERAQRAAHLRKAYFAELAYRSSIARSQRAAGA